MDEDATTNTIRQEVRSLNKQLEQWTLKSRNEARPVCLTCARLDYSKGKMKDYEAYTEGFKEIAREVRLSKAFGAKAEEPREYIFIDYKCPRGHGHSMQYETKLYDELTKSKAKAEKK